MDKKEKIRDPLRTLPLKRFGCCSVSCGGAVRWAVCAVLFHHCVFIKYIIIHYALYIYYVYYCIT